VLIVRNQGSQEAKLRVSPNPINSQSIITCWSDQRQNAVVTLTDASGKTMVNMQKNLSKGSNSFPLNAPSGLPSGIYYLRLVYADGISVTEKILVSR
jgi:hypothetical protein